MAFIEIGGCRYPRVIIKWKDIIGAGGFADLQESRELVCPSMVTEGYLFDVFEEDGERYVRTFASYQISDEAAFADRNCIPFSVLSKESKRDVEIALMFMNHEG
tara:strand:- start:158 stop:469 length:312 start_codon:yes stop_codon:yes gene_type:complete